MDGSGRWWQPLEYLLLLYSARQVRALVTSTKVDDLLLKRPVRLPSPQCDEVTPSSTAQRSTARASFRSGGSPGCLGWLRRIAPKPRRLTVKSPRTSTVPASAAVGLLLAGTGSASY
jgi:hypothetical protein